MQMLDGSSARSHRSTRMGADNRVPGGWTPINPGGKGLARSPQTDPGRSGRIVVAVVVVTVVGVVAAVLLIACLVDRRGSTGTGMLTAPTNTSCVVYQTRAEPLGPPRRGWIP